MKQFFKSYNNEVFIPAMKWSKDHWKGLVVLTVVAYSVELGVIFHKQIADKVEEKVSSVKEKFHKD